ncbi:hypothetical protein QE152_g10858 [Popillia japonica]|uniref:Uncharacterized protein n=1 Tax=Popillia japonica TaxID=7064 RepID=A0AAW1LSD1_POPJA
MTKVKLQLIITNLEAGIVDVEYLSRHEKVSKSLRLRKIIYLEVKVLQRQISQIKEDNLFGSKSPSTLKVFENPVPGVEESENTKHFLEF